MWMINQAKCIKHVPFEKMAAAWKDTHLVRINQENTQSMLDNSRTIAIRKDISGLNLRVYIILSGKPYRAHVIFLSKLSGPICV